MTYLTSALGGLSLIAGLALSPVHAQDAVQDDVGDASADVIYMADNAMLPAPLTCLLSPRQVSDVGSDRTGIVLSVPAERADFVEKGDVLVRLDSALIEAELARAQISIEAMKERLERFEKLDARNLIAGDEIEKVRTDLRVALAEANQTQLALARTQIRAPFSGYVSQVIVAPGELTGTDPLLRLIDVDTLRAEMVFVDSFFGEISVGDRVTLDISLTGAQVEATVIAIDPFLDVASNSFSVLAHIDNSDRVIPAGVSCDVVGWDHP